MLDFHELRLVAGMRAGRQEAFAELYDRYAGRLLGYALRLCGTRAEAEDLVQETLVAAWAGREGFHGRVKLLSWLLGILSRRRRDLSRHREVLTVSATVEEGGIEPVDQAAPGRSLESSVIDRITLDAALASLELPFREALLLVHSQGLTYREAAEVMGEPAGTVKWRVSEALKAVERRLAEGEEEIHGLQQISVGTAGGS